MAFERQEISRTMYRGREIVARFLGPDLIGYVDGVEMPNFYMTTEALYDACKLHVNQQEKDKTPPPELGIERPKGKTRTKK